MMNDTPAKTSQTEDYLQLQSAEGMDYQLEIAGMGARSYAFIIDWHIRLLLAITWVGLWELIFYTWNDLYAPFKDNVPAIVLLFLPAPLIYFFYHPVLEILMAGRTPGKRMAGVRLVNFQGHTPGIGALLLRNVFRLIDSLPIFYFLGLVSVAVTDKHLRIGDLAAGTVLIYDNTDKSNSLQQISTLTLHSRLSGGDQALLLDLLKRWNELSSERRISFAEQFLIRIGRVIPSENGKQKKEQALKQALQNLLTAPETQHDKQ